MHLLPPLINHSADNSYRILIPPCSCCIHTNSRFLPRIFSSALYCHFTGPLRLCCLCLLVKPVFRLLVHFLYCTGFPVHARPFSTFVFLSAPPFHAQHVFLQGLNRQRVAYGTRANVTTVSEPTLHLSICLVF